MLHAVEMKEGESADEFRKRRMMEAIHLKRDKGKLEEKEEMERAEKEKAEAEEQDNNQREGNHGHDQIEEDDDDNGSEDDLMNEDTVESAESMANAFLLEKRHLTLS